MKHFEIQEQTLFFYGNSVGFITEDGATVDVIFQCEELTGYLKEREFTITWQEGVYDNLLHQSIPPLPIPEKSITTTTSKPITENIQTEPFAMEPSIIPNQAPLPPINKTQTTVELWRLSKDSDVLIRFVPYEKLLRHYPDGVERSNYTLKHRYNLPFEHPEEVYAYFIEHPIDEFSLSLSDVIQISSEGGEAAYYIDRLEFVQVPVLTNRTHQD